MPKIDIAKAYRPTGDSLEAKQFLDYVLVCSKDLDLKVLQDSRNYPKKLRIYSNSYKRNFPDKFFKKFHLGSHSYFFGKYSDLDIYILFEPIDNDFGCSCSKENAFVNETVADIFLNEILLLGLSK
jgi:hypothetical protein